MQTRATKKMFLQKFYLGIKNAEFHADFKFVEKVVKIEPKKCLAKT
jgi:hypothetical protein